MKVVKILLSVFLMLSILTGCEDTKESITGAEFRDVIKEYELEVKNYTSTFSYADIAYKADTEEIYLFYLDGKKTYDVEGLFLDECENVYKEAGNDYKRKTRGGDDWLVLEVTSDEKYYYLSMINDTYIVAKSAADKKSLIEDIVDDLGY